MFIGACCRLVTVVVALLAIAVGMVVAGVPSKLGLWRALADANPQFTGLTPAFAQEPWGYTWAELRATDLSGQLAIVTGANSGLGYATALHLARQGAHVLLACRSTQKCSAAEGRIRANFSSASVETMALDTASLRSVRAFGEGLITRDKPVDMLVLNAGRGVAGSLELTEDGHEAVMAVNHIGHQYLFRLLRPLLQAAAAKPGGSARVVLTSSSASFAPTTMPTSLAELNDVPATLHLYERSKLAQVYFAQELAARLGADSRIYVNAAHPGAVDTQIWEALPELVGTGVFGRGIMALVKHLRDVSMWTAEDGALTQLFLAVAAERLELEGLRGRYFHPQAVEVAPNPAMAAQSGLRKRFIDFVDELIDSSPATR